MAFAQCSGTCSNLTKGLLQCDEGASQWKRHILIGKLSCLIKSSKAFIVRDLAP
jgi:hypothetical protein